MFGNTGDMLGYKLHDIEICLFIHYYFLWRNIHHISFSMVKKSDN